MAAETNDDPDRITYLELRADHQIEMRYEDGRTRAALFLQLRAAKAAGRLLPADRCEMNAVRNCLQSCLPRGCAKAPEIKACNSASLSAAPAARPLANTSSLGADCNAGRALAIKRCSFG